MSSTIRTHNPSVEAASQGGQLKLLRAKFKLTQEEFAKKFGVPLGTFRRWEINKNTSRAAAYLIRVAETELAALSK